MRPRSARAAKHLALAALVAGGLLAWSGEAGAYPQFQFSSGTTRCNQCHYAPAGGGLLTSWGRDEAGDTISLAGNGALLHGAWTPPSWLGLGGDFRLAFLRNDVGGPESPETAIFPMQFDVYARAAISDAFSFNVTVGDRGIVRPVDPSLAGRTDDVPERIISREHYFMYRPSATGFYARVGRFFAPYGLRFVEHIFWVRRYTGFNLYQETYNLSGGYLSEDFELHVTAFAPPPTSFPDFLGASGPRQFGGAVYAEQRFAKISAIAAQARIAGNSEQSTYQGGLIGKLWFDPMRVLLLGEGDFIRQQLSGASFGQNQFVGYLGATFFVKGVMATIAGERYQEDLAVKGTGRDAVDFEVNFFPYAHFELELLARYIWTGVAANGVSTDSGTLAMLQLHYYL
jgi:hypothetical protein